MDNTKKIKGAKNIDFLKFSNIWENRNISQKKLREKAWKYFK